MKRLAIIGSGDLGQQIAYHAEEDNQFKVVGFFDDFKNYGDIVNEKPILGGLKDVFRAFEQSLFDQLLIGVGYKHMKFRGEVFSQFKDKIPFARLLHSSSLIDKSSVIGEGVIIYPGCIIDQNVLIKENVLLNIGCCVAHDTVIDQHCFFSPRVAVAGFVKIESNCVLGINATVIDNLIIINETQVGAGGVVIENLTRKGLYVGNPVRFIR